MILKCYEVGQRLFSQCPVLLEPDGERTGVPCPAADWRSREQSLTEAEADSREAGA